MVDPAAPPAPATAGWRRFAGVAITLAMGQGRRAAGAIHERLTNAMVSSS